MRLKHFFQEFKVFLNGFSVEQDIYSYSLLKTYTYTLYYLSLENYDLENISILTRKSANRTEVFKSDHQIACKSLALTETTHIPNFVKNIFSSTM